MRRSVERVWPAGVLLLLLGAGCSPTDADEPAAPTDDPPSSESGTPGPTSSDGDQENGGVVLVTMPPGFTEATGGAPESFTARAASADGCLLSTRTTTEPADANDTTTDRERTDIALAATVATLSGHEATTSETWFAASGQTDLEGDPIAVTNAVQADWIAADQSSRLAMRSAVVPRYSGTLDAVTAGVLMQCPTDAALDESWDDISQQIRLGLWLATPEQPSEWTTD